jgi:hypothetical protein
MSRGNWDRRQQRPKVHPPGSFFVRIGGGEGDGTTTGHFDATSARIDDMPERTCFSVVILVVFSCAAFAQKSPQLSSEEYKILAASVDLFRKNQLASHPFIADHTSTFACDSSCNGFAMGGCNGLRRTDETPAERLAIVERDLPKLEETTISDFKSKNERCSEVGKKIPTQSPYFLFGLASGEKPPSGWEHPDFFYFSRVAFSPQHTQALLEVSFMSGTSAADSGGRYFLFVKKHGRWELEGSSAVWELTSR